MNPKWIAAQDDCPDSDRDVFIWYLIDSDMSISIGSIYCEGEGSRPYWHVAGSAEGVKVLAWAEIP